MQTERKISKLHPLLLAGLFLSLVNATCFKPCDSSNYQKGIIKGALADIKCLTKIPTQSNFVIDRQEQFDSLFAETSVGTKCPVPVVDFTQYSVLGLKTFGMCKTGFVREVTANENKKRYYYKVSVINCGSCRDTIYSYNWVTIPKRDPSYLISFEVIK